MLSSCGPTYKWVAPPGHSDIDISWDVAFCKEKKRERLVMQGEEVDPEECLKGRGWKLEPVR